MSEGDGLEALRGKYRLCDTLLCFLGECSVLCELCACPGYLGKVALALAFCLIGDEQLALGT